METSIKAELKGENILVSATFSEDGEEVHGINTSFPIGTSEEEIREEIEKSARLFEQEKEQKVVQQEVDSKFEGVNEVISNLNK